jgi:heptosyltransferase-1/heptosyltransferase-2
VHDLGLKVIYAGGKNDIQNCQDIALKSGVGSVVLAGETSLGESLALYKRALATISADTGPLHLADSVGAKAIGIFGPTRPEITGPRGSGGAKVLFKEIACNKTPCYHLACANNVCMQSIAVDDVFQNLKKYIC